MANKRAAADEAKKNERAKQASFQDSLFDPSRTVERTLEGGTIIRLKLEPLGHERVRVLEYSRKRAGSWQCCLEEEGRVTDYRRLGLPQLYSELFSSFAPSSQPSPTQIGGETSRAMSILPTWIMSCAQDPPRRPRRLL